MPRKPQDPKLAVFHPMLLTNGQVAELEAAGFLPVIRWVKSDHATRDNPRTYRTKDAMKMARAAPAPEKSLAPEEKR